MSLLGITELIKRLKTAFTFVNVLLQGILSLITVFYFLVYNNTFTLVKK